MLECRPAQCERVANLRRGTHERLNEWRLSKGGEAKATSKSACKERSVSKTRDEKKRKQRNNEGKEKERKSEEINSVTGKSDCYILPPLRRSSVL